MPDPLIPLSRIFPPGVTQTTTVSLANNVFFKGECQVSGIEKSIEVKEKSSKVKKILSRSRKIYQGQEKAIIIEKELSEPREPHKIQWGSNL
jgi:hypothetical protein